MVTRGNSSWNSSYFCELFNVVNTSYNCRVTELILLLYICCWQSASHSFIVITVIYSKCLLTTCKAAWCVILGMSVCLYVCMYVCLSDVNFRKPRHRKFIFSHVAYLCGLRVEFVYEGHWVRVKVTRAKNVENSYSRNVKLQLAITPVLSNIEPWCLRAAWGFLVLQIEWCDRHLCHVTSSEHT